MSQPGGRHDAVVRRVISAGIAAALLTSCAPPRPSSHDAAGSPASVTTTDGAAEVAPAVPDVDAPTADGRAVLVVADSDWGSVTTDTGDYSFRSAVHVVDGAIQVTTVSWDSDGSTATIVLSPDDRYVSPGAGVTLDVTRDLPVVVDGSGSGTYLGFSVQLLDQEVAPQGTVVVEYTDGAGPHVVEVPARWG